MRSRMRKTAGGGSALSDEELANLLSTGSPEQIRAALPRMTPELRQIAEMVLKESANEMRPRDPKRSSIDPRRMVEREGLEALAATLAEAGYIIQRRLLVDLGHSLRSRKPLLVEGPRGGGKTALAEVWPRLAI